MNSEGEDRTMRRYHGAKDGWQAEAGKKLTFGRLIEVDEVARAIAYLGSDESGLMTGSIVDFDQIKTGFQVVQFTQIRGDSSGRFHAKFGPTPERNAHGDGSALSNFAAYLQFK